MSYQQNIANVVRNTRAGLILEERERRDPDSSFWERDYFAAVKQLKRYLGDDETRSWLIANVNPDWSWLRMARAVQWQVGIYAACPHDFHTEHGSDGSGEPDGDIELVICHECELSACDEYLASWKAHIEDGARIDAILAARTGGRQ